jgi:hypothetical protein
MDESGMRVRLDADQILMDAVKKRTPIIVRDSRGGPMTMQGTSMTGLVGPKDRVEDLLSSIVGLEHIKSQVWWENAPLASFFSSCILTLFRLLCITIVV